MRLNNLNICPQLRKIAKPSVGENSKTFMGKLNFSLHYWKKRDFYHFQRLKLSISRMILSKTDHCGHIELKSFLENNS